jgi:hypothetical protein
MMESQLPLFAHAEADEGAEYDYQWIRDNPIPAFCARGGSRHGRQTQHAQTSEQIHAPALENVRCFWCWGKMRPCNPVTYEARMQALWQHVKQP